MSRVGNKKCFVAYYDMAKAFNTVEINGLFYQLYNQVINGRI